MELGTVRKAQEDGIIVGTKKNTPEEFRSAGVIYKQHQPYFIS
jgi:hypothetical protein